jgi:hypothetical protein
MTRLVIVGRLRSGAYARALELVRAGPPFDPATHGFDHHAVYLSADEAIFVFEATAEVEWRLDDLIGDFREHGLQDAFEAWRPLLDGEPRLAREEYTWQRAGR